MNSKNKCSMRVKADASAPKHPPTPLNSLLKNTYSQIKKNVWFITLYKTALICIQCNNF